MRAGRPCSAWRSLRQSRSFSSISSSARAFPPARAASRGVMPSAPNHGIHPRFGAHPRAFPMRIGLGSEQVALHHDGSGAAVGFAAHPPDLPAQLAGVRRRLARDLLEFGEPFPGVRRQRSPASLVTWPRLAHFPLSASSSSESSLVASMRLASLALAAVRVRRSADSIGGIGEIQSDGEQRGGVGEQQALAAAEPQQVRIPVLAVRRAVREPRRPDHGQELAGAPHDHRLILRPRARR